MTDFRQRQAISTLTAPAARGLTPHSLVQPGTRLALCPATGTIIQFNVAPIISQTPGKSTAEPKECCVFL